jgi:anti-anti-sigma regulatory factor
VKGKLFSGDRMLRVQIAEMDQTQTCALEGKLSFESALQFKEWCEVRGDQVCDLPINIEKLDFVGSMGIMSFIEGLKALKKKSQAPVSIRGAKPEFKILCQGLGLQGFQFE